MVKLNCGVPAREIIQPRLPLDRIRRLDEARLDALHGKGLFREHNLAMKLNVEKDQTN